LVDATLARAAAEMQGAEALLSASELWAGLRFGVQQLIFAADLPGSRKRARRTIDPEEMLRCVLGEQRWQQARRGPGG
ncbi:MAG TPA: hypothetical protein VLS89_00325, partial [Candidatus Nanopelagicales bacterium]|nr:hypothetical protein [Candidatus Nanopelagicales bacterium]